MKDAMHEAGDKLAEVVSMYIEGRADMEELQEAGIAYYQAHENRIFAKEVGQVVAKVAAHDPNAAITAHYAGAGRLPLSDGYGDGMHDARPGYGDPFKGSPADRASIEYAEARGYRPAQVEHGLGATAYEMEAAAKAELPAYARAPETQGYYICTGGKERCQDCRCGKPAPINVAPYVSRKIGDELVLHFPNSLRLPRSTVINGRITVTMNEADMIFRGVKE